MSYLAKSIYCLVSVLRWKSLEQYSSVLLDFEQNLKKDWGLNSFLSILLVFNIFLAMPLSSGSWSLCFKFSISFLMLLLLKRQIMFYYCRLEYSFLFRYFLSILSSLFPFPFWKLPKLNEQEDKLLQEVFIIIILKCLKLGLEKI